MQDDLNGQFGEAQNDPEYTMLEEEYKQKRGLLLNEFYMRVAGYDGDDFDTSMEIFHNDKERYDRNSGIFDKGFLKWRRMSTKRQEALRPKILEDMDIPEPFSEHDLP